MVNAFETCEWVTCGSYWRHDGRCVGDAVTSGCSRPVANARALLMRRPVDERPEEPVCAAPCADGDCVRAAAHPCARDQVRHKRTPVGALRRNVAQDATNRSRRSQRSCSTDPVCTLCEVNGHGPWTVTHLLEGALVLIAEQIQHRLSHRGPERLEQEPPHHRVSTEPAKSSAGPQ